VSACGRSVAGVEVGISKVKEGRSDSTVWSERMRKASSRANRGSTTCSCMPPAVALSEC